MAEWLHDEKIPAREKVDGLIYSNALLLTALISVAEILKDLAQDPLFELLMTAEDNKKIGTGLSQATDALHMSKRIIEEGLPSA